MEIIKKEINKVEKSLQSIILPKNDIFDELKSFINGSSKKIRSKLGILYLKANNVELDGRTIKVLSAGELIHNASLLHDDVIDESDTRRGKKTIGSVFNPKVSVLSGDYLVSQAVKNLIEINSIEILKVFMNCTQSMSEAEISQYMNKGMIPTESEYLDICAGKTSSLFIAILLSLAISSNLDTENAKELGRLFGILFQIKNDLSKESEENDKKNGINTAKDIFGIEKTNDLIDNYKKEIKKIISTYPNAIYREALEDLTKGI